jgi:alpha-1,2-mannosyltransferase
VNHASARALPGTSVRRAPGSGLAIAGLVAFGAIIVSWLVYKYTHPYIYTLQPVDLHVYTLGGEIVRHVSPWYNPHLASPLYDWPGYTSLHLPFAYTPFAALVFAVVSFIPWTMLPKLSVLANIAFLVAALWFTFGGLGYRSRQVRIGATLLTAAAVFWTEPVVRVIYLGQIELALMALIMWDMCQPDRRWWKGAGVGIAAGIKLVPLIFIPYLLLTRRFRQAIVASATFVATIVLGFAIVPADSAKYWFTGLFWNGANRSGFVAWEGNQSMRALVARLLGGLNVSDHAWLAVDAITIIVGIGCAVLLDRKGHRMPALMAVALTGLLASPISWDHHWVWIAPCVAIAGHYAVQAMTASARSRVTAPPAGQSVAASWRDWAARARMWASSRAGWGYWAVAAAILAVFGAWPGSLWSQPRDMGTFSFGLLWFAPGTGMATYEKYGDLPTYPEYRWHGISWLAGNAYVLSGIALMIMLLILAYYAPYPRRAAASAAEQPDGVPATAGSGAQEPDGVPAAAGSGAQEPGRVPPAAGSGAQEPDGVPATARTAAQEPDAVPATARSAAARNGAAPAETPSEEQPEPAAGQGPSPG